VISRRRISRNTASDPTAVDFLRARGDAIHPLAPLGAVRNQVCRLMEFNAALGWLSRVAPGLRRKIIDHLISSTTVYPPGTFVELSDGSWRVLRVNEADRMRPVGTGRGGGAGDADPHLLVEPGWQSEVRPSDPCAQTWLAARNVLVRHGPGTGANHSCCRGSRVKIPRV
jgi:hypothetical protein